MQQQQKIDFAPSFSCYSSDSITSTAVAKVIREEEQARFYENEGEDYFEFSLVSIDEEVSIKEIDSRGWTVFPEIKVTDDEIGTITGPLGKLFVDEREESSSCSSSEANEVESVPSGTYCVWRPKADDGGSSPLVTKCKKSRSTGSGSKRWIFRYLFRRSNSEGKQPMVLLTPKKVDSPKHKRNSGEVLKIGSHEQFYVQRRAENEIGKRKSYLPYRKDLVGLFANVK